MTNKKKIYLFSASALLIAAAVLLLFGLFRDNKKPDINGMFKIENMWFEQQKEITDENAQRFIDKINTLQAEYLTKENEVFYTIVPDRSYYIVQGGYPVPDYSTAFNTITKGVNGNYIDITTALSLKDYYNTDPHWRQERLQGVVSTLGDKMDFKVDLSDFTKTEYNFFIGSYSKNLAGKLKAEGLYYLENESTKNADCQVFTRADFEKIAIYSAENLTGKMPYDVFLNGATPLVEITNSNAKVQKELVIFRDSYGSSLAPLLIDSYSKITLIDLRYMASIILPQYITFTNQDVLFMYSTPIIADSALIR